MPRKISSNRRNFRKSNKSNKSNKSRKVRARKMTKKILRGGSEGKRSSTFLNTIRARLAKEDNPPNYRVYLEKSKYRGKTRSKLGQTHSTSPSKPKSSSPKPKSSSPKPKPTPKPKPKPTPKPKPKPKSSSPKPKPKSSSLKPKPKPGQNNSFKPIKRRPKKKLSTFGGMEGIAE